jgi:hypothetical protein
LLDTESADVAHRSEQLLLEGKDASPVVLHIDDRPALRVSLIERLVEFPHGRVAIIGPLTNCVIVMDEQCEERALSGGRSLQHLRITVGVARRRDRATTDMFLDGGGLPGVVVNEIHLGELD